MWAKAAIFGTANAHNNTHGGTARLRLISFILE
jgi:hypothetical protein